jgi:thiamine pyrophosphate-dependent acetolactate synthase large subunit-like protein
VSLACTTAIIERDVAHLVFPDEVQNLPAGDDRAAGTPDGRMRDLRVTPPDTALAAALSAVAAARRPLIIVGAGAHDAMPDVMALAERLGAPVMTTFKAKGLMSDRHPLGCGVLGRSGTPVASWFMNESDLMIAFGASFSNHTGIADYKPIVQVDRDPMALGRFHAVTVPVLGDVGVTARALLAGLPDTAGRNDLRAEVAQRRALWQFEKQRRQADDRGRGLSSAAIFAAPTATVPDDAVLCVDVGNNAYAFGRYFESSGSQDVLMSGYLGSIGFALPAAMGAWAAVGDTRKVVGISGDDGFGQYAMELTTLAKYGMPITHVLLDNGELGKISKDQRAGECDVWQTSLRNPDFAAFAELCGVRGFGVRERGELEPSLRDALAHPGPALVHIANDPQLV